MRAIPLKTLHRNASHKRFTQFFKQARRDSNPQPPVLETGALPVELRTSDELRLGILSARSCRFFSGQGRNRTTDTTIFSRVLYQLSYLARYLRRTARATWRLPGPNKSTGATRKKIRPAFRRRAARRGVRAPVFLEALLDGRPSRTRPRVRHRPSPSLLRIGLEHR